MMIPSFSHWDEGPTRSSTRHIGLLNEGLKLWQAYGWHTQTLQNQRHLVRDIFGLLTLQSPAGLRADHAGNTPVPSEEG